MEESKKPLLVLMALPWLVFQLYLAFVTPLHPLLQNPLHLLFALLIVFWYYPAGKKYWRLVDAVVAAIILFEAYYYISNTSRLQVRIPYVDEITLLDRAAMYLMTVVLLEAVRRTLGWNLLVFLLIFIFYGIFGEHFPGIFRFRGIDASLFTDLLIMTSDGIFGIPLGTSASYLFYFILFGAFFSECGGGKLLLDMGLKVGSSGNGGPAKAAVISSSLIGMVSGSAVANVTTTGVMTIPLMKKVGYKPEQAAAIEAVASTGGQIMPPIMGIGAFIMAEMLGVRYWKIAVSAVIPALVYYLSAFLLVDFLARRNRLKEKADLAMKIDAVLPRLYLLIPPVVLVYFIVAGASLMTAAVRATMLTVLINLFDRRHRLSPAAFGECIRQGTKQAAGIAVPTAAAGIIIGIAIHSGVAQKLSMIMASVGGGNIAIALLIASAGCIVLGMALPTVAAYIVAVILFVPTLTKLGVLPLAAHMFVFYFGIIAQITPPVCLASFTAAGIAGANSWKTGWTAFHYSLVAFLVPFVFVFQTEILLEGSFVDTLRTSFVVLGGTFFLVSSVSGFLLVPILNMPLRIALLVCAILIILPETLSSVVGFAGGAILLTYYFLLWRKTRTAAG